MNTQNFDKKLTDKIDSTGVQVQINFAPTIGESPVLPVFLREYAKLMEQGYATYNLVSNNRSKAIYAVIDNKIIGIMVYDFAEDIVKTTWINFSFVDEKFRKRGIFKILHQVLEEQVKTAGSKKICSAVHVDNDTMLKSAKSVGRLPIFYRTEKQI